MYLCFWGGAPKTMVVCCYCCKNIGKNICYEKNYYRQNRYNYYGTSGNLVSIGHNFSAGIGNIAHYGQIGNSISSCHRFGDTNAYLAPFANGDTIFISFGKTIVGQEQD